MRDPINTNLLLMWFISENLNGVFFTDAKIEMNQFHGSKVTITLLSDRADSFSQIMFNAKKLRIVGAS